MDSANISTCKYYLITVIILSIYQLFHCHGEWLKEISELEYELLSYTL